MFFMALGNGFPERVANRCKGESSFAIPECACTVKNRLSDGWNEKTVLRAYYAKDVEATPAEIITVTLVLDGSSFCDDRLYFMFGLGDVYHLGLLRTEPITKIVHGRQEVWFYEKWYRKRKR